MIPHPPSPTALIVSGPGERNAGISTREEEQGGHWMRILNAASASFPPAEAAKLLQELTPKA